MDSNATAQAEFVAQITRHQPALRAYIISLMPGMDGVSDVLQETNLVLWEKRASFKPGTNFRAWACAIARYEVKSHRRKQLRRGIPMLEEDLAELLAGECEEQLEETDDRLVALERCLQRLNADDRTLIEHRYASPLPLSDYGKLTGRPVGSLRVSLFRIRAALRNCIGGQLATARAGI